MELNTISQSAKLHVKVVHIAWRARIVEIAACEVVEHESLARGLLAVVGKARWVKAMITYVKKLVHSTIMPQISGIGKFGLSLGLCREGRGKA